MNKKILIKKGLVVAVILLFIGVVFAPSINADINKDGEMVEYTTELYGLNGGKQTVKLTQDEADGLEQLLDDIQIKLNNVESITEAKEIVSDAIIELDKYGLLGDLSIKQVQRLILSGISSQYISDRLIEKYSSRLDFWNTNLFCLVGGYSKNVEFFRISSYIFTYIFTFPFLLLTLLAYPLYQLIPFKLISVVSFGSSSWDFEGPTYTNYAKGIISSIGLLGIKCWIGEFKGVADTMSYEFAYSGQDYYLGIIGFIGVQISRIEQRDTFLLGSAIKVKMKYV